MIETLGYLLLALASISFLIFIHELGHYFTALAVGMRVEVFSIGFGKPIFSWESKGVKWQVCWLPFGGFVKIAGTEPDKDPYTVEGGFFTKSPLARIAVLAMGPLVNFAFGLLAFSLIWGFGGREKPFSEYTNKLGWVDTQSELYQEGIRPGDQVLAYDDRPFHNSRDHLLATFIADDEVTVKGNAIDYATGKKEPFALPIHPYPHPNAPLPGVRTLGILEPASYLIYHEQTAEDTPTFLRGSAMEESGIQSGDRIVWVNGTRIFSPYHLQHILNDDRVLLTIRRGDEIFQRRVPRVPVGELRPDEEVLDEWIDWQFEAHLNRTKFPLIYTLPYDLTPDGVVQGPVRFIDEEIEASAFPESPFSDEEEPLEDGDRIIAVQSIPIDYSHELLAALQDPRASVVVLRSDTPYPIESAAAVDQAFELEVNPDDLSTLLARVGQEAAPSQSGSLVLLPPVQLKQVKDFLLNHDKSDPYAQYWQEQKRQIEAIEDLELRNQKLAAIEERENLWILGVASFQDRQVSYNPNPFTLFDDVISEIWLTLKALFSGNLSPKWLSGPVGIIYSIQEQSKHGFREALFWLGAISVNLGLLNLLPIPMLDGGNICFTLFEFLTRRRIHPKTMEKLILPFALILIGFFLFLTYHDISRLVGRFFG